MKFPVALQVFSVRDFAEKDFYGTLKKVKEMGYEGVEFAGLYGHSPAEVKKMLEEIGLEAVSAHVAIPELLKDIPGTVAAYREIGCKYIAIPWLAEADRPGAPNYPNIVKAIRTIAEEMKKQGGMLLYHNHNFEFVLVDGEYALDKLYEEIPADLLQTELDTCWVNVAGEDPAAYIRKYAGRAPIVHLKDFVMPGKQPAHLFELIGVESEEPEEEESGAFEFRPNGYGVQDFKEILKASEEAGASWVVVEQDNPSMGKNSLECAKMSVDYLKTIME